MKKIYIYIIGFVLSLVLTLIAFGLDQVHEASGHVFPTHETLLPVLSILAVVQLLVQLIFFLHMGQEKKPRWNLMAFLFAVLIATILIGGTLWIMHNLQQGHASAMDIMTGENIFPTH